MAEPQSVENGRNSARAGSPCHDDADSLLARKSVNWRSVVIGLIGVLLISLLTAYNDFAINNTYLIGTYFPVGVLLFLMFIILGLNVLLRAIAPSKAITSGELGVILTMLLVACAVPASGLMRYLPTHLVGLWWHAGQQRENLELLKALHLPDWWFPKFASSDPALRPGDPIVGDFFSRVPVEQDTFLAHLKAVPYRAWLAPIIGWGIFISLLYGAIICLSIIVRQQWIQNERLPFPIATIYLSLIEEPEPGRKTNALFRSRGFWIAGAVVFFLHALNALHQYNTQRFPEIPLGFDLTTLLANDPWIFLETGFKIAKISFAIAGLTYFLQSGVSFSLWFFYIVLNVVVLFAGPRGLSYADYNLRRMIGIDQLFGGCIPFLLMMLWVGRAHWAMVLRSMVGRAPSMEYAKAGWGLVICIVLLSAWLVISGTTVGGAVTICLMMLMVYLIAARIVAETGLMFVQVNVPINRIWAYMSKDLAPAIAMRTTLNNYFTGSFLTGALTHDVRENLTIFATQSLKVTDAQRQEGNRVRGLIACMALALAVALVVSAVSFLYVEYTYATTLDRSAVPLNSPWGIDQSIRIYTLGPSNDFRLRGGPTESHSRLGHFAFGAGVTAILGVLRLRFAWWPLHPVGYLLMHTYVMEACWFSIFIGWLVKVVTIRLGGGKLYHSMRVTMIGLIVGEVSAAGFWLIVSLVLHALGYQYTAINLMPV